MLIPLSVNPGKAMALNSAEERLLELEAAVSKSDWRKVIDKALVQAKDGDWRARQWLGNYLMGKPIDRIIQKVEITHKPGLALEERAAAVEVLLTQAHQRAYSDEVKNASVEAEYVDMADEVIDGVINAYDAVNEAEPTWVPTGKTAKSNS